MSTVTLDQPIYRVMDSWQHQLEGYHRAFDRSGFMLAMWMGTGKSKTAVDLLANWGAERVLILCPKSVLGVWRRELATHWPQHEVDHWALVLDRGSCKDKAEQVRKFLSRWEAGTRIVVANYDICWREPLASLLLQAGFTVAVCDESHRIKAPGGKASRWCQKLGRVASRKLCLTGTPMPHSPLDLYGQFRFMKPSVYGTSYARFRSRYAICNPQFPSQVRQWINEEDLQEKFHANAYVCRGEDVLDLPEITHNTREVTLSAKARRVYADLEKDLIAEVDAGTITVANALVKLIRLQQITSGYVAGRDEQDCEFVEVLDHEKERALLDLLEDVDEPTVVFCRFQRDLDAVERIADKLDRCYGELSGRRRDAVNDHAQMAGGVDIAGVQIQAGGVGIDLTRAALGVYYSIGFSLGDYLQSVARLHRPGQTRWTRFYHLLATGTVDEKVYKALDARQEVVESVLQAIRDEL